MDTNDSLAKSDSVAASVKHFAAYGAVEAGREYNTTDMSESRLRQLYLPPYKAAVDAGAATIMSSFNALNGVPGTVNRYLLDTVLREEGGFNGFVVSDYTAIMELMHHGIALDSATAAEKAFHAGVDVDMMSHLYDAELPVLIRSGRVSMSTVDEAVRRVLRVKFALGLFEHPYPNRPEVTAAVPEHRQLVRRAAEGSIVLLKNDAVAQSPLPVVLLVFSGCPLVLTWAAHHVPAILEAWFPGTEAGNAIANILYGDAAPSGKLPMSFPVTEGQERLYYNHMPTGRPPETRVLSHVTSMRRMPLCFLSALASHT